MSTDEKVPLPVESIDTLRADLREFATKSQQWLDALQAFGNCVHQQLDPRGMWFTETVRDGETTYWNHYAPDVTTDLLLAIDDLVSELDENYPVTMVRFSTWPDYDGERTTYELPLAWLISPEGWVVDQLRIRAAESKQWKQRDEARRQRRIVQLQAELDGYLDADRLDKT